LRLVRVRGRFAVERLENVRSLLQVAPLEKREPEVHAETGEGGVDGFGLAVVADGFRIVLLPGLQKADVGAGFGVVGAGGEDGLPCRFGREGLVLLLESDGGIALPGVSGWALGVQRGGAEENGGEGEEDCQQKLS
jgi:hypothetical protein